MPLGHTGTQIRVAESPYKFEMAGQVTTHKRVVLSAHKEPQWNGFSTHYLLELRPQVSFLQTSTQILD